MKTSGTAVWTGGAETGSGAIFTECGTLTAHPFGFADRFEGRPGIDPVASIGFAITALHLPLRGRVPSAPS